MRFNVLSSQAGKLFGMGGSFYVINLDKSLPPMQMGGSGDPHMMLRIDGGAIVARWDDNAPGSQGTELLFFHLETDTDTVSVFYTNKAFGPTGPKIIESARYIHNGTSYNLSLSGNGTATAGPVSISGGTYHIDVSFGKIENVRKFGGGFAIALAAAQAAGGYVDGGWGPMVDGYGNMAALINAKGIVAAPSRNDMVVGQGVTITNGVVSASSSVIFNTDNESVQQILGFANANCIGARAVNSNLPLDPAALVAADINKPGGDFDGLVNPPEKTNGIIDEQGNTGAGLHIYGANLVPASIAGVGTHNAGGYSYQQFVSEETTVISWE